MTVYALFYVSEDSMDLLKIFKDFEIAYNFAECCINDCYFVQDGYRYEVSIDDNWVEFYVSKYPSSYAIKTMELE